MSSASFAASFILPSFTPPSLALCKSISPSLSPTILSYSPLRLHSTPSFFPSSFLNIRRIFGSDTFLPRFVLRVASSSKYAQEEDEDEDGFEDGDEYEDEYEDEDGDEDGFDDVEEPFVDRGQRKVSSELKLFVGNLSFSVGNTDLSDLFQQAGNVTSCEVIYDRMTERSRGFAFVTMSTHEEVVAAAKRFNGYELHGRQLRVNFGPPPPRKEYEPSGRGRGDSNFDDGGRFGRGRDRSGSYNNNRFERSSGNWSGFDDRSGRGNRRSFSDGNRSGGWSNFDDDRHFGGRGKGGGSGFEDGYRSGSGMDRSSGSGRYGFDDGNRVHVSNIAWGVDDLTLERFFGEKGNVVEAKVICDRMSGRSRGFGFVTFRSAREANNAVESLDGADLEGRQIRVAIAEDRSSPPREF